MSFLAIGDDRYHRYFSLFNAQAYYEAHEVLEDLWHEHRPSAPDASFFQGLIQLAGGFCHLKWHYGAPLHRTHSRRLAPGFRLFGLAAARLSAYPSPYQHLETVEAIALCYAMRAALHTDAFRVNPWSPGSAPTLGAPASPPVSNLEVPHEEVGAPKDAAPRGVASKGVPAGL